MEKKKNLKESAVFSMQRNYCFTALTYIAVFCVGLAGNYFLGFGCLPAETKDDLSAETKGDLSAETKGDIQQLSHQFSSLKSSLQQWDQHQRLLNDEALIDSDFETLDLDFSTLNENMENFVVCVLI